MLDSSLCKWRRAVQQKNCCFDFFLLMLLVCVGVFVGLTHEIDYTGISFAGSTFDFTQKF